MALYIDCIPCQYGQHEHHYRVVQAVPEGMMGGAVCVCEGECERNNDRRNEQIYKDLETLNKELRLNEE